MEHTDKGFLTVAPLPLYKYEGRRIDHSILIKSYQGNGTYMSFAK